MAEKYYAIKQNLNGETVYALLSAHDEITTEGVIIDNEFSLESPLCAKPETLGKYLCNQGIITFEILPEQLIAEDLDFGGNIIFQPLNKKETKRLCDTVMNILTGEQSFTEKLKNYLISQPVF